jgi:hypothetical protein
MLWLRGLPVGMGEPFIPTASTVTLAIVASPFSSEEPYQSIFIKALRSTLEKSKHLVKTGDIISVGIDTSALRSLEGLNVDMVDEEIGQRKWVISLFATVQQPQPETTSSF